MKGNQKYFKGKKEKKKKEKDKKNLKRTEDL